jgi:hypothetical protein
MKGTVGGVFVPQAFGLPQQLLRILPQLQLLVLMK